METQTTTPATKLRRAGKAIGSKFLVCNQTTPVVRVQILDSNIKVDESVNRPQEFVNVIDLGTGQPERLWIGRQFKYTLSQTDMKNKNFEIVWVGRNELVNEETGEIYRPNSYEVYPLA